MSIESRTEQNISFEKRHFPQIFFVYKKSVTYMCISLKQNENVHVVRKIMKRNMKDHSYSSAIYHPNKSRKTSKDRTLLHLASTVLTTPKHDLHSCLVLSPQRQPARRPNISLNLTYQLNSVRRINNYIRDGPPKNTCDRGCHTQINRGSVSCSMTNGLHSLPPL